VDGGRDGMSKSITLPSDSELVDACLRGDRQAAQQLFERHHARISGYIRGRLYKKGCPQPSDHGENVCQDTLERAYSKLAQLDNSQFFVAWLIRIAKSQIHDHLDFCISEKIKRSPLDDLDLVSSQTRSVHQVIESAQRAAMLLRLADDISSAFGQITRLYHVEELDFYQIAAILNISYDKARNIYYRNLAKWKSEAKSQDIW
jgi:RNA polymerase sigma factor (sigma-70 family)